MNYIYIYINNVNNKYNNIILNGNITEACFALVTAVPLPTNLPVVLRESLKYIEARVRVRVRVTGRVRFRVRVRVRSRSRNRGREVKVER